MPGVPQLSLQRFGTQIRIGVTRRELRRQPLSLDSLYRKLCWNRMGASKPGHVVSARGLEALRERG